ncbi:MAG: flavin reductase family protein [Planctomycetes bacterium]|nr:flavin reductase family protein [Planctomycetota bacterium]
MPSIDPDSLSPADRYRLLISAIVPRPIAWVTSLFPDGSVNAAPFSYFNGVSSTPPLVSVAVGHRGRIPEGVDRRKDTAINVARTGELVINLVPAEAGAAMVGSSAVSEVARNGLATVPSETLATPGLALARVRLECRVHTLLELPEARTTLVLARVLRLVAAGGVLGADGLVDLAALDPLGRLGGESYCRVREPFALPRPGS